MRGFYTFQVKISNGTIILGRRLPINVCKNMHSYWTEGLTSIENIWQLQELDIPLVPAVLVEVENEDRYQYCESFECPSRPVRYFREV
jgi:hypothetical protein